jgi:hypothetical protein
MTTRGWIIAVIVVVLVVGLVAFARGRDHHRGDEVGALGRSQTVTAVV